MRRIIESPLKPKKKICLNINTTILELVKDLAKLTNTNNTIIIEALLFEGVSPLFKQFKTGWTIMSIETKDEKKKKHLKDLLQRLQEISRKKEYLALISLAEKD